MKTLFVGLFVILGTVAYGQNASYDFSGSWKTEDDETVTITKTSDVFSGIEKASNKSVMENLKFADGKWKGTLIKRSDDSKHDGTFVVDGKKLTITVKVGFISKTFVWTKI